MKLLKLCAIAISIGLLIVLALEGLLRFVDPLGVWVYFSENVNGFISQQVPDATGYRFEQGRIDLGTYQATILKDGSRYLPDAHTGDCTIVWLGDSVTFGWGVADGETFVNLIALQFPEVTFINTARPGYNMGNIVRLQAMYPAEGYLYVALPNDTTLPIEYSRSRLRLLSAISTYWFAFNRPPYQNDPNYDSDRHSLLEQRTLTFDFEINDWIAHTISPYDSHPNVEGHRLIANKLLSAVQDFVTEIC